MLSAPGSRRSLRSRVSRPPPSWRSGRPGFTRGGAPRVSRGRAGCLRSHLSQSGLKVSRIALAAAYGGLSGAVPAAVWSAIVVPLFVDVALAVLRPVEDLIAQRYVGRASAVLARVRPLVVGITGSYGKTTTKTYVAHLIAGDRSVVASPRSFNNRAGLARTVNEHLVPGTEVLVAEMGAYGPGEISALCRWLQPEVVVITSIGPAHLERFGTLDRTLSAKAEITSAARVVVLNIDDERLEGLAADAFPRPRRWSVPRDATRAPTLPFWSTPMASSYDSVESRRASSCLAPGSPSPIRSNAACAAAVAVELGIDPEVVVRRLASLPGVPNRLQRYEAKAGYVVLDDTFNANPAGARHALDALAAEACEGRRVLVTPGMVELGRTQPAENSALAETGSRCCDRPRRRWKDEQGRARRGLPPGGTPAVGEALQHAGGGGRVGTCRSSVRATPCCSRMISRTTSPECTTSSGAPPWKRKRESAGPRSVFARGVWHKVATR